MADFITSSALKELYRHRYGQYLVINDGDDYERIYNITQHLISYPEINTLKDDLGKDYGDVMERYNGFVSVYTYVRQLRTLALLEEKKKKKKEYLDEIKDMCIRYLPAVNQAVILVFHLLYKNTDLKKYSVPTPLVKSHRDNSMPNFQKAEDSDVEYKVT